MTEPNGLVGEIYIRFDGLGIHDEDTISGDIGDANPLAVADALEVTARFIRKLVAKGEPFDYVDYDEGKLFTGVSQ